MASGYATVKQVLSGDTVVLIGQPKNGPPPEIRLSLASLQAPRLSVKEGVTDEPFAWQSREFLRQLCIGKYVSFKVEYTVQNINREFGEVRMTTEPKENLCVTVARAGWARVRKDPANPNEKSGEYDELVRLSETAEAQGLGVFNTDPVAISSAVRNVTYEVTDANAFLKSIKGVPQRSIIEYIRDGSSFKVLLPDTMTFVNMNLAGVQCPRLGKDNGSKIEENGHGGKKDDSQPFAREAKYFTEIRLLNRDVMVVLNGVDENYKTFFGVVEHPRGDIGVELVKNGLAKTADWSMAYLEMQKASSLRAAARDAKSQRLRIWKDYVAPKISGDKMFEGVISEVISGDTIAIRIGSAVDLHEAPWKCTEQRVTLSSIRAPRFAAKASQSEDEPYADESKDFLRAKILGRRCQALIEYEKAPAEGATGILAQPRKFGTVMVDTRKGRKNAATLIVESGLAEVLRHRADDERSQFYDSLMQAQEEAKADKKKIWSDEKPEVSKPLDLTASKEHAKANLAMIQSKGSPVPAFVEYVHNGSRLRLHFRKEGLLCNFAMNGIMSPQTARPAGRGRQATVSEPWADEAAAFTKSLLMQREVSVLVESIDKGGTALGQCYSKKGPETINMGVLLIEMGLARVNEIGVRFTSVGDELIEKEEKAKEKHLRIWQNYVPPPPESPSDPTSNGGAWVPNAGAAAKAKDLPEVKVETVTVSVTEIVNGYQFFMVMQDSKTKSQSLEITREMRDLGGKFGTVPGGQGCGIQNPRRNSNLVALFDDGTGMAWYRAKILAVHRDQDQRMLEIRYIDFGNAEVVSMERVREPPSANLFRTPGLAQECALAFLKSPPLDRDFGHEAAMFLNDVCFGKNISAQVHGKGNEPQQLVSLFQKPEGASEPENLAELMMQKGLGYLDKNHVRYVKTKQEKELVERLQKAQDEAHSNHIGMWRYGDPRDEGEM